MTEQSPLHDLHKELGARFTDFGGWEMPVRYGAVLEEHGAVRETVGWFDVSHLGRFACEGPGATNALSRIFSNNVEKLESGRTHYTMILNEDGGVLDDLIIWRWAEDEYWVLPNAANHDMVLSRVGEEPDLTVTDLRPSTVMLAIQGPAGPQTLTELVGQAPLRFRCGHADVHGAQIAVAGTGYTGERGGEIVVPNEIAHDIAESLNKVGATPCGLAARDTLRLEAGLPLWGQDLDAEHTPLEAGLSFAIDWDHDFVGKTALETQKDEGLAQHLVGFRLLERGIPRLDYRMRTPDGAEGVVTSGNISPVTGDAIGLGYLSPVEHGDDIEIEIRDRWVPAQRAKPPFHR
ncbi:MAG: glycine cleavage system aminomethyltransferase GcvT [Acidimicrobiia bacterium]|nr:glycine cleavage system aminomethyltransferase GcvT [Acidimicrobiia bacterium]